jgi:hypothetical protein
LNLAYYISGHGYGHAVRSIEVIKELLRQESALKIHIRTGAPQWLFDETKSERTLFYNRHIEVGALQNNSYSVNKEKTLKAYAELLKSKIEIVKQEAEFLSEKKIDLVVSDHTPLAFDAASQKKIPAIGAANFSWDWIYGDYLAEFPEYEFVVNDIKKSYSLGEKLYRMPFYGDMSVFKSIEDVPVVGRRSLEDPAKVRLKMGLAETKTKLVLMALKAQDISDVNWDAVGNIPGYTFIILSKEINQPNVFNFPEGELPFHDIVKASDAVISKPGYSMVAEILINQTQILYVPREDFVEDFALREGLEELAVSQEISLQEFNSGLWESQLDLLFNSNKKWAPIETDGAEVLAGKILAELR